MDENGNHFIPSDDNDFLFEGLIQNESMQKEKSLCIISKAKRERSNSGLSFQDKPIRTDRFPSIDGIEEVGEGFLDGRDLSMEDVRKALFESIPEPYPHSLNFQRVVVTEAGDPSDPDTLDACKRLKNCMDIRSKWINAHPFPPQDLYTFPSEPTSPVMEDSKHATNNFRRRLPPKYDVLNQPIPYSIHHLRFKMINGVMVVKNVDTMNVRTGSADQVGLNLTSDSNDIDEEVKNTPTAGIAVPSSVVVPPKVHHPLPKRFVAPSNNDAADSLDWTDSLFPVYTYKEFMTDFYKVKKSIYSGPVMSYSYKRLELLSAKFHLHLLLNAERELEAQKSVPHRDFYNCRKVDTHVHHSACMNQKHLLRFIKHKLKKYPNDVVTYRDGRNLTLGEVFMSLNLTAYDLSIDTLDMHAHDTFHRFDRFNLKYNPAGQSRLREIFLKTDNVINGRYLAEITKEVIADLEASKYTLVEWRVSIYGRKPTEWDNLAQWFYQNRLAHENVRWLIQIPRLYHIYKSSKEVETFAQMLDNIFSPLFAVSLDPSSNPALHYLLQTVVGIDSVDDESRPELEHLSSQMPRPDEWTSPNNPPYAYWMYYMYANICVLNQLRASRGLCTFQFRPHCGEAGDVDHLVSTYMVAHQINHGILLRKNPGLQYLYYLSQVGIAMSPLSNNKLFLDFNKNPFPKYFYIGMNVSLSTDDPLMLHFTKDALLEEYSVAAQVWKLSAADQCEIARNSVLQSGFENRCKLHYLGKDYSDIKETNVPEIRLMYRKEALDAELKAITDLTSSTS